MKRDATDTRVAFVLATLDRWHREWTGDGVMWGGGQDVGAQFIDIMLMPGCCTYDDVRTLVLELARRVPDEVLERVVDCALKENAAIDDANAAPSEEVH